MADDMKLGIVVDTDTRATRAEFSALRREIKREAEGMEGDWERAGEKIENALREAGARDDLVDAARRIGREGPSELEKMQRALRDVDDTARSTADAVDDAAREISDAFEENALTADDVFGASLKAEIVQNAAESGAEVARGLKDGFDSEDVETIVDGISDTIVAVGTLGGPIGTAGGLAAASAMNLIVGPVIEDSKAKAEEFQATFTDAFANIATAGADMGRQLAITSIAGDFAEDTQKMADATTIANAVGIERGIVLRAMAGDVDALNIVEEKNAAVLEEQAALRARVAQEMTDHITVTEETAAAMEAMDAKTKGLAGAVDSVTGSYENNTDALNAATDAASAKAEADNYAAEKALASESAMAVQTGTIRDLKVTIDGVTRAFQLMPDGKTVEVTDGNSAERTQEEIDAISGGFVTVTAGVDQAQAQGAVDAAFRRIVVPVLPVRLDNGASWTPGTRRPV